MVQESLDQAAADLLRYRSPSDKGFYRAGRTRAAFDGGQDRPGATRPGASAGAGPGQPGRIRAARVITVLLSTVREVDAVSLVDPNGMTLRSQPVQLGDTQGDEPVIARRLALGEPVVTASVHVLVAN